MTLMDWLILLVGLLVMRFTTAPALDVLIVVVVIILVWHWALGERFAKLRNAPPAT